MKKKSYDSGIGKVRSFDEIKIEKTRLRMETLETREGIRSGYQRILNEFTFSRIMETIGEQLASRTSVISKAYTAGKNLFSKIRHKKKKKTKES